MAIQITESDITIAVALSQKIPEFEAPYNVSEYQYRLKNVPHLILIASVQGYAAGFKVGYEREDYFYSWMGGVLPAYRRQGVAQALAEAQEVWAKRKGYTRIVFKTRNQHKGMLMFALRNGFDIIGFEPASEIGAHCILLQKYL